MRSARLLGHQHQRLDAVAATAEGAAAITLCRGGAHKTYGHVDPNEDAVCFALGAGGTLVAVADGHHGARGAERAIEWLLARAAAEWTAAETAVSRPEDWTEHAARAFQHIHRAVIEQGEALGVVPAPTTLSLALVRPAEDLVLHASVGDSHVFLADADGARDVGWAATAEGACAFLGDRYEGGALEPRQWRAGSARLAGLRAVLVASDGLSEHRIGVEDPQAAAAEAAARAASAEPELRPLAACKHLTAVALEAQRRNAAGDNVSTGVVWIDAR